MRFGLVIICGALDETRLPLHARFRQQVAWLWVLKTATAELMRIDWASVGGICRRVYDDQLDAGPGTLPAGPAS